MTEITFGAAIPPIDIRLIQPPALPSIGIRLGVPMEDGRQIDLTAWVDRDEPDENLDRVLDKIQRAANRIKARTSLPELRSQLTQCDDKVQRLREDLAACDARFQVRYEAFDAETARRAQEKEDRTNEEIEKWDRRGEFRLQGAAKTRIEALVRELAERPAERGKIDGEHQVERSQKLALLKDSEAGKQALLRQIDAYEAMARGECIDGVEG